MVVQWDTDPVALDPSAVEPVLSPTTLGQLLLWEELCREPGGKLKLGEGSWFRSWPRHLSSLQLCCLPLCLEPFQAEQRPPLPWLLKGWRGFFTQGGAAWICRCSLKSYRICERFPGAWGSLTVREVVL